MRTLVHLSDLHFGRVDEQLLAPLRARITSIAPDLVVVSGDLTQRAREKQFEDAARFLGTLPHPQLVVPGNHDVPLHNLYKRFVAPLKSYRRHVGEDLEPFYLDDEIAVVGINTARSLAWKNGRINEEQLSLLKSRFDPLASSVTKVVVTHHPFDLPQDEERSEVVGRARAALRVFAACGVDFLLSGHMHAVHAGSTASNYQLGDYAALSIHAGTTTSTRGRGEPNSFNALHINGDELQLDSYAWNSATCEFLLSASKMFSRQGRRWVEEWTLHSDER
jgi:3',5'-cyclic AMP phosphodiesterase CpdA